MGKNKKRKKSSHTDNQRSGGEEDDHHTKSKKKSTKQKQKHQPATTTTKVVTTAIQETKRNTIDTNIDNNPLQTAQQTFLTTLSPHTKSHFFSPTHLTPERRATIWEDQADLGETLINSYSWATPDNRTLPIFQHFGPIVEVGCGANAYWSKWMNGVGGVDVLALDVSLEEGGKIGTETKKSTKKNKQKKNKQGNSNNDGNAKAGNLVIRHGTPKSLSEDDDIRNSNRTLFLCYPDEEDFQPEEDEEDDDDEDAPPPMSMAASCLEHFTGSTIIHVGELFGDTLSLDQAPFGRSSSNEFQQRLAGEYHCILKMKLQNNWLHVRDTLSVWKRSETCCMAFANDDGEDDGDEDDEDEEVYYKYIPPEEVLPIDLAAPCVAHLLSSNKSSNGSKKETHANVENKADDGDSSSADSVELDKKVETSPTSSSGGKNKKKRKKKKNNDSSDSDDNDDKQEITTSDVDPWDSNDEQEIIAGSAW
mmetsp:Transcript_37875/g.64675  ORF Transcript_37875/g.64675 Transcript_37875/m.64675 type:complete len:477 (+) Transcript_37875:26-1456(+)